MKMMIIVIMKDDDDLSRIMTKSTKWHVHLAKTDQPGHPPLATQ